MGAGSGKGSGVGRGNGPGAGPGNGSGVGCGNGSGIGGGSTGGAVITGSSWLHRLVTQVTSYGSQPLTVPTRRVRYFPLR